MIKASVIKNSTVNRQKLKIQPANIPPSIKNSNVSKISTRTIQSENHFSNNYKNNVAVKQNYSLNSSNKGININSTNNDDKYNKISNSKSNYTYEVNFNGSGTFLGGYKADLSFLSETATTVVVGTKVVSGVLDVAETIYDGLQWTRGKIVEGNSFVAAQLVGVFNSEAKNSILDWRENEKKSVKESIAKNMVDDFENKIYNTKVGTAINNYSYIKYDSNFAERIENITKITTEIAVATAATIATGGTATVAVVGGLGFLSGTGNQAQKIYQETIDTTNKHEIRILFSGLERATEWYALGRLGSSTIDFFNQVNSINAGGNTILKSIRNIWNTRRHRNQGVYLVKSFRNALTETNNIIDMLGVTFESISESLNNESILNNKTGAKLITDLTFTTLVNTIVSRVSLLNDSFRTIYPLEEKVISLAKVLLDTFDAAEDSNLLDVELYNSN